MNNKKALRMAVTLAIINMPLLAQAADVSPVRITDGSTYTMTADSVINTGSNTTGIFVGYKDGGTIVGDNVTVTSDGYGIQIQTYATAVSYTHLDVYKRQQLSCRCMAGCRQR